MHELVLCASSQVARGASAAKKSTARAACVHGLTHGASFAVPRAE